MADLTPPDVRIDDSSSTDTNTKHEMLVIDFAIQDPSPESQTPKVVPVPLKWKLASILMVSAIGFGSNWSSGITGAMKTTIKKEMKINNTQFALLEASEDFMVTALMLVSGLVTDRIGGAGAILYGNLIFTIGSILVASATTVRNYRFMVGGRVIQALGDIATQVAQYKIFSSWFPPNHGFASTLGLELGIGKIGAFAGKASANIIAQNTGNFSNVFWVAVGMNVFTNLMTLGFWFFTRYANKKFMGTADPATGEALTEKNKKFEWTKVVELPWVFWAVMAFSLFETSTAIVFTQNATELAEIRLGVSAIDAGWYTSVTQYGGFFIVPLLGVLIDLWGNRISILLICGTGVFIAMALVNWTSTTAGTSASLGVYAVAFCFGPTAIIDSIRTSMWHQSVFGSAYAIKITMNNAMNIIVRVITGRIQDADNNSYEHVTIVYVFLAACSVGVSLALVLLSFLSIDLRRLQWTRNQRVKNGDIINERNEKFHNENGARNRAISKGCFGALVMLVLGSWVAYFWGVGTGNNS
ncbi:Major facilitator superfamily domain-containing protein [Lachnellula suecica]|uniref:Lysosomal dipeptide transporter MFSD1 n=1 Tax=Lachnellula suecica TaxID=602035 RepID=A0A8T9C2E8_9HELO|nr:Major facilitator superfamily domain-containing protein [Lachnellula suecica]